MELKDVKEMSNLKGQVAEKELKEYMKEHEEKLDKLEAIAKEISNEIITSDKDETMAHLLLVIKDILFEMPINLIDVYGILEVLKDTLKDKFDEEEKHL